MRIFIATAALAACLAAPAFAANRGGHLDLRERWAALTQSNEAINEMGTPDACQSDDAMSNGPWADRHLDRPDCAEINRLVRRLYALGCKFGTADGWWCPPFPAASRD
jgi:hypothetical protein